MNHVLILLLDQWLIQTTGEIAMTATAINIYTSLAAAVSVKTESQQTIVATRKANIAKSIARRELFVNLDQSLTACPSVPESFKPLVEAILIQTLKDSINNWRDQNPLATTIPSTVDFINQHNLILLATEGQKSAWMTSEQLTEAFDQSATWKRIQSNDRYKSEQTYRQIAGAFRDMIIRLAAKNLFLSEREQNQILAKMDEQDMTTPLGEFIAMRIDKMRNKPQITLNIEDL